MSSLVSKKAKCITVGDMVLNMYPRAIADPTFAKYHSKLLKVNRLDWWEIFCMQVKDVETCELFIKEYEKAFDIIL